MAVMPGASILPRQGEVAPKVTEGEDTERWSSLSSPSVWQAPATSPWRGRIEEWNANAFRTGRSPPA